jgi:nicotinamide-nucleotide amidase
VTAEAGRVVAALLVRKTRVATAESCTGGLVAAALTAIPGSSQVVDRGFVTYSNEAKTDMLGVPAEMIAEHGAVSENVARAMAEGALARSQAGIAVSTTGIAGPGRDGTSKPVGLVHFALAAIGHPTQHHVEIFEGDREAVRRQAVLTALGLLGQAPRPKP